MCLYRISYECPSLPLPTAVAPIEHCCGLVEVGDNLCCCQSFHFRLGLREPRFFLFPSFRLVFTFVSSRFCLHLFRLFLRIRSAISVQ